jgi:hypothetical protein
MSAFGSSSRKRIAVWAALVVLSIGGFFTFGTPQGCSEFIDNSPDGQLKAGPKQKLAEFKGRLAESSLENASMTVIGGTVEHWGTVSSSYKRAGKQESAWKKPRDEKKVMPQDLHAPHNSRNKADTQAPQQPPARETLNDVPKRQRYGSSIHLTAAPEADSNGGVQPSAESFLNTGATDCTAAVLDTLRSLSPATFVVKSESNLRDGKHVFRVSEVRQSDKYGVIPAAAYGVIISAGSTNRREPCTVKYIALNELSNENPVTDAFAGVINPIEGTKEALLAKVPTNTTLNATATVVTNDSNGDPYYTQVYEDPQGEHTYYCIGPDNCSVQDNVVSIDAHGSVLGFATPGLEPDTAQNPPVEVPLMEAAVQVGAIGVPLSDANGEFVQPGAPSGPLGVASTLSGPWVSVTSVAGANSIAGTNHDFSTGPVSLTHNPDAQALLTAQVNTFVHVTSTHNFLRELFGENEFLGIDYQLSAVVNKMGQCNAFFDPANQEILFFQPAQGCTNSAFSTVIAHEYGHFVVNRRGLAQGAFGEGYGDSLAVLQYDTGIIGQSMRGPGLHIRNVAAAAVSAPCEALGVHGCGQALGGTWYDIKENLKSQLGATEGLAKARQLFAQWTLMTVGGVAGWGSVHPSSDDEILFVDDDNGNLSDGTPHRQAICAALAGHGVLCPELDDIEIIANSTNPTTVAPGQPLNVSVQINELAALLAPNSAQLIFRKNAGPWSAVPMTDNGAGQFSAAIPGAPCAEVVDYFVQADSTFGQTRTMPADGSLFSYAVGSLLELVHSEFFSNGAPDWSLGIATDTATAGTWELGRPIGSTAQQAMCVMDGSGTQDCLVTGIGVLGGSAGSHDIDGGVTTARSPEYGLPSTAETHRIRYFRAFSNNLSSLPADDTFTIDASFDAGLTWTNIETLGPEGISVGWEQRSAWLTPPAGSTLMLQLRSGDEGAGSVVEAAFDALEIHSVFCDEAPLPAHCSDGIVSGDEVDVDCGGACPVLPGSPCATDLVDECADGSHNCDPQAQCTDTADSFTCTCNDGYTGDGNTCTNVNECDTNNGGCNANATCEDTPGTFTCTCDDGYTGDGNTCTNVNECDTDNGGCNANATCEDTPGSFICTCDDGYTGNGNTCANVNECDTDNGGCNANATCEDTPGSFICTCDDGYTGNGNTCTNVNECDTNNGGCDANATCEDTPGSFTCTCGDGYTGNGNTCTNVNECDTNSGGCDANAACEDTPGSFICTCDDGYTGNGNTCTNVNECDTNNGGCDANAACEDTPGSFICTCDDGYTGNGNTCTNVNECDTNNGGCDANAACEDTPGSFICTCDDGYTGNGNTCADVDECALGSHSCVTDDACVNEDGGFACAPVFIRGDCNSDGRIDISDPTNVLNYLFGQTSGSPQACLDACDVNDDGAVDISDVNALLMYVFQGTGPLAQTGGTCGIDQTPDNLACAEPLTSCQ